MRATILLALALAVGPSCAHLKKDKAVCEEYRKMRCVFGARCSFDHKLGCEVCQCQKPADTNIPADDRTRPTGR